MLGILLDKNCNLRATRDLLLRYLISGKLNVEHLEIEMAESTVGLGEVVK